MSIISLLASEDFIAVNRTIATKYGLDGAVVLGEIASEYNYWENRGELTEDGFFYSTIENMAKNTFMSAYSQREALKKLEEAGLITVKKMGMPAKRYIKIHEEEVLKAFNDKSSKNLTTSGENISQQVVQFFDTNNNRENNNTEKEQRNNIESKRTKFVKPTVEEIQNYIDEKFYTINAQYFFNYYEANGWYAGKNKMKDWKRTLDNWQIRENNKPTVNTQYSNGKPKNYNPYKYEM